MAAFGVHVRPRLFREEERPQLPQMDVETSSEMSSSPGQSYTPTEVMFLKTDGVLKGVLQIHRASWLQHDRMLHRTAR